MIWIIGYIIMVNLTWPALFADVQYSSSIFGGADRYYRKDLSFSVFLSLLPPIWIAVPFMTGFYEHGFKWK